MTTLTLADYAASPKPLIAGVASVLYEASPIMASLPFENAKSLNIQVVRTASRPTISWRRAGEDHGSSKGRTDLVQEQAYSIGNYIDVDKMYVKDGNLLYDARALWTKQTTESMAFEFNDKFINGSPATDVDAITGLYYRLTNDLPSGQHINLNATDISADSAGLTAAINTVIDGLDKLMYSCAGHKADFLVMNDTMMLRLWSALRQAGVLDTSKDQFGREFWTYKGAKMLEAGFKIDETTRVIGNVEASNGTALTGAGSTSIYAYRTGKEYLTGFQEYAMDVQDIGLLEDGVTYRTVVDWVVGLAVTNPRSVARLSGIVAA